MSFSIGGVLVMLYFVIVVEIIDHFNEDNDKAKSNASEKV